MKKIGLAIYGFHVKDTHEKETDLRNIRNKKFSDILEEFLDQYEGRYDNDQKNENVFSVVHKNTEQRINNNNQVIYNLISGRVKTGDYGITSELVNTVTGEQKERKPEDAEVMPFSFGFMYSGSKVNHGIAVFQTEGQYGMKTYFMKRLKSFLYQNYDGINISTSPIAPIQYIRNIMDNGSLKKLRFLKYVVPSDTNVRLGVNEGIQMKEERIYSNLTGFIERKRRSILDYITGRNNLSEIINLKDFDYDELRMEFKIGRSVKTLNMSNIEKIVITVELNDNDLTIEDGHPTHESLVNQIKENAYDYLQYQRK